MTASVHRTCRALPLMAAASALLAGCGNAAAPTVHPLPEKDPVSRRAQYDALNAIQPAFGRYAYDADVGQRARPAGSGAAAAHDALTVMFPAAVGSLDAPPAAAVHARVDTTTS